MPVFPVAINKLLGSTVLNKLLIIRYQSRAPEWEQFSRRLELEQPSMSVVFGSHDTETSRI